MSYRKSSYNSSSNFNYNLNTSYSSSNVFSSYNFPETALRSLHNRRESKTTSFTDFSLLKQPVVSTNDIEQLPKQQRKVSYISHEYNNKKIVNNLSKESTNVDTNFLYKNNFNQCSNKTLNNNIGQGKISIENTVDSNLQQQFLKRLLNAHNTVDNLLRDRGLRIEDESNYLMSNFSRHQEAESPLFTETNLGNRFKTKKYNFITQKYSQSINNNTIDSESSSAYSSSSIENNSIQENVSEADDTSVDSVLHTDSEEDLPEDDISAHSFLEVNLSEYVPTLKNISGSIIKILPLFKKQFGLFNITSKQFILHNPFNNTKGFKSIILPQYHKSAVTLKILYSQNETKNYMKNKKNGMEQPIMIKKNLLNLKRISKIGENNKEDICHCKAEISIQHFSYSYKKLETMKNQITTPIYTPLEKLIRLHLRLTNHPPLKVDVISTFILNKQTIAVEKCIKIAKKKTNDKKKLIFNDINNFMPNSVNLYMFNKNRVTMKKESLTPQFNLKVPEIFLKEDGLKNPIKDNIINKKLKSQTGVNIFKMLIDKQNQNIQTNETENNYKEIKLKLKKVNFPNSIKGSKNKSDNNENLNINKINEKCKKVTNTLNNKKESSLHHKENIQNFSVDIDKKLIERFCNTNHIPKPISIIKNYSLPTMPKTNGEKEIIIEKEKNNNTPHFIRYKSPKRLIKSDDKNNDKTILKKLQITTNRRNSVAPEITNTFVKEKRNFVRSYSECPKVTKNVYSHSFHNFGVSLKSVKDRLLQTKEDLDRKPPKEIFIPQWRKKINIIQTN
uniref:Arrestin_C domain-containing protein n=1 Tax=Strongyloides stercoralis TaxID=6248 RepID=A0A0K0ES96_STRER